MPTILPFLSLANRELGAIIIEVSTVQALSWSWGEIFATNKYDLHSYRISKWPT